MDYEGLREETEGPMERENSVRERHGRRETSHERDSDKREAASK